MKKNEDLLKLLSFAHCANKTEILSHAQDIAIELIRNWKIVTPWGERRFWGLEFYLRIPKIFEDEAPHSRRDQLDRGTFYFHTKAKGESIKDRTPPIFNRHGVDITCGDDFDDEGKNIYGGILLRHLGGAGHRDGSGLALRSLVRGDDGFKPVKRGSQNNKWSVEEISFFERMYGRSIFGSEMHLEYAPLDEVIKVDAVARIGIDKTNYATENLGFRRRPAR